MPEFSTATLLKALRRAKLNVDAHESVADFLFLAQSWSLLRESSPEKESGAKAHGTAAMTVPSLREHTPVGDSLPNVQKPASTIRQIFPVSLQQSTSMRTASKVDIPEFGALRNPLLIARALRPFGRRFRSAHSAELDEEATADLYARNRNFTPVFRPALERWLDVVMVVEDAASMAVWKKTLKELERLLGSHGAFRDVRRVRLVMGIDGPKLFDSSSRRVDPRALIEPNGRRLVLLFTHGADRAWNSRETVSMLLRWGGEQTVAIVSMLPKYQWEQTMLGEPDTRIRSLRPAQPNAYYLEQQSAWQSLMNTGGHAVPILSLQPADLAQWARMVMGHGSDNVDAIHLFPFLEETQESKISREETAISSEARLGRFRANATPEAFRLITALAGSPLTLPIMRLVQQTIFRASELEQSHLAEVLLSGLIERVHHSEDPETDAFDFYSGMRMALAQSLELIDRLKVRQRVFEYIRHHPESTKHFPALIPNRDGTHLLPSWAEPFAEEDQDLLLGAGVSKAISTPTRDTIFARLLALIQQPAQKLALLIKAAGTSAATPSSVEPAPAVARSTGLELFNTLTGKIEPLVASDGRTLRFYCCGPTVYDYGHIGNFRAFLHVDILRRTIKLFGTGVQHVMSVTDVDDKIIRNAIAANQSIADYTARFERSFFEDMDALGVERPEHIARPTENIDEMVALIERLASEDIAYKTEDGSWYFRISRFPEYGKLSRKDFEGFGDGEREPDEYDKDAARDFALWKAAKPGEPSWETPLGPGRPGWHIECSAMAMKYLGDSFDLHAGGEDLMFPHHENEIAQSESVTHTTFAKHWYHVRFLLVEGRKMSKSEGNFYTLRDLLLKGYRASAIRFLMLSVSYRQQLNFTLDALAGEMAAIERLRTFQARLQGGAWPDGQSELAPAIADANNVFTSALSRDLNTAEARASIFNLLRAVNGAADQGKLTRADADDTLNILTKFDRVFAILEDRDVEITRAAIAWAEAEGRLAEVAHSLLVQFGPGSLTDPDIDVLVDERTRAKRERNFARADAIRNELLEKGIAIEDSKDGARWRRNWPGQSGSRSIQM